MKEETSEEDNKMEDSPSHEDPIEVPLDYQRQKDGEKRRKGFISDI